MGRVSTTVDSGLTNAITAKYAQVRDPGIRAFLIEGEKFYPEHAISFTTAEQRAFYDLYCAHFRKPRPVGLAVEDFAVGPIPCRRYLPQQPTDPTVLYLHGGFVLGGLDSHDDVCAELAVGAETEVVAVQYRLAPEHPFPAALNDCWEVFGDLRNSGESVVLAGDSGGETLRQPSPSRPATVAWPASRARC